MTSMEASIRTTPRPRRRQAQGPNVKATVTLVVAIVAGALMMYAAYLSQSGLRSTAWEKEQTGMVSSPPAQESPAPAPAQPSGYVVTP
jgi:hypothetical protein